MAGAGRRTFQPGEVLTASNVNSYLMDQSVMRFASSAARGSAVGTAVIAEGMVSYLDDANALEFYDGASWNRFAAGSGLPVANGGTGGTSIANAQTNLRVGASTIIPSSVSVVAGTASVGATGVITLTSARGISLNSIFTTEFTRYDIQYNIISAASSGDFLTRLRVSTTDDSGASDYRYAQTSYLDAAVASRAGGFQSSIRTGRFSSAGGSGTITILYPNDSSSRTIIFSDSYDSDFYREICGGFRNATKTHDGITLITGTITVTGTVKVFGYRD